VLDRTENVDRRLVRQVEGAVGRTLTVEDIGWYAFGILSAPEYRRRFATALHEDHPRIPFPVSLASFEEVRRLGEALASIHLGEVKIAGDIRFDGEGSGRVDEVRYDEEAAAVWVNSTQRFTGVSSDAWAWGGSFRPLEHYLDDRRGRRLDTDQIQAYQSAIHAVRECIRLAPVLDAALDKVLADPLAFGKPA